MVYPHEKIQYISTKECTEVQDHTTSPIFLKERAPDENKLLRETQARLTILTETVKQESQKEKKI